jgi:hypothetical protein
LPPPPPPSIKLDWQLAGKPRKRDNLLTGEGDGVGQEPNYMTARKAAPLQIIQRSLVQFFYFKQSRSTTLLFKDHLTL